jgi:hypothetical protein
MLELYDLDTAPAPVIANFSARGRVGARDEAMIGGFILGSGGNGPVGVIVRGLGPSLAKAGVAEALQDPAIELRDASGNLVAANDNWKTTQADEIEATTIPPLDDRESAIVCPLSAGAYTVILRGKDNATGVGLLEVYAQQQ